MLLSPPPLLDNSLEILHLGPHYHLIEPVDSAPVDPLQPLAFDSAGFALLTTSTEIIPQWVYSGLDPVALTNEHGLAKEFGSLVKQWEEETLADSSLTKIYAHPAYQRIIAMGRDGLPHVLRELATNGGRWFYALKFMAGQEGSDVAAAAAESDYETARALWLEWGYRNNCL